jgi:hypothetical protein
VQQRHGADRLSVVLIDVDPGFFEDQKEYLPRVRKIMDRLKLDWPNTMAPKGFHDVVHAFNLTGYGNIVVDAKGIVRGVNVHGKELERLVEEIMGAKKADKSAK